MISNDDELLDIYEMSTAVSQAYSSEPNWDIQKECNLFQHNIKPQSLPLQRILKIAAVISGIALLSIAAIIGFNILSNQADSPKYADVEQPSDTDNPMETAPQLTEETNIEDETSPVQHKTVKNLPGIKQYLAQNPALKSTEKQPETANINIDEYLRVQQARIDNDIATLTATAYQEEFATLLPLLEELGINTSDLALTLGRITMQ